MIELKLKEGDKAPDFKVKDQDGNTVALKELRGKNVVIYFYPKDDTATCTVQSCNLRDNIGVLKKKGIEVFGVSVDDEKSHQHFIKKFSLPFPLLADTDHKMVDAYGVGGEKNTFGHVHMGIHRTTFLINEEGKIDHILQKIDAENHAQQIMETWGI